MEEGRDKMEDNEIMRQINALTQEEHEILHTGETAGGLDDAQHARLNDIKVELDRLWDLLRQRRARRHAGLNPDGAEERPAAVVEHFQQ